MIFNKKRFALRIDNLDLNIKEGETILSALKRQGTEPPYFCEGGACGVCCLYLRNGTVRDTRNNSIVESVNNNRLVYACVSKALSDIAITYNNNDANNTETINISETTP